MINFFSKKIADFLAEKAGYDPEDDRYQSMLFYIKAIFHNVIKTAVLLVAALWISLELSAQYFVYMIFLMCIYGMIKRFSYGVHSSNEILCTVTGLVYYLGSTFLAMRLEIPFVAILIVIGICLLLNHKYAPAPTKKRMFGEKETKRLKGYVQSVYKDIFLLVLVFWFTALPVFLNLILFAVTWQTITVLPITYRLLNERRE